MWAEKNDMWARKMRGWRSLVSALVVCAGCVALAVPSVAMGGDKAFGPAALADADTRGDGSRVLNLIVHDEPVAVPAIQFIDAAGQTRTLADYRGKVVAVHFWATWCFPCRDEMPTMDAMQREIGADRLAVLPLSVDRDGPEIVSAYYQDHELTTIPVLVDEKMKSARALKVNGIPYTIFVDREGREFARVLGDRDWSDPEVLGIVRKMVAAL